MVVYPNTVIEPWAMMVESFDATVADGTVSGARCAQDEAVWAHLAGVDFGE